MILVTGANGFIGAALIKRLNEDGLFNEVIAGVRSKSDSVPRNILQALIGDALSLAEWNNILQDVNIIVHCAGRAHVMQEFEDDTLKAYQDVNVKSTLNMARRAAQMGVQRFIFISSIKVNGESTLPGQPFKADDKPAPLDPYGISKFEAEQGLRKIEAETDMKVTIVRPPLVYGPGVKANFALMMRWVASGIPLPFGAVNNSRSLVALDNLVDLLVTCIKNPAADGQTFLVSDGEDVSTANLLHYTAQAMKKKIFLLPVPFFWLKFAAAIVGKTALAQRLCDSLQVDINKTCNLLNWSPPVRLAEGLRKTIEGMKL